MNKNVIFNIEEMKKMKDAAKYKISIKVPMDYGWIEDMYFVIEKGKERISYKLKHSKNEEGYVIFENEIDLDTRAIYSYYFSYFANGKHKFHKQKEITRNNHVIKEEMFKLSVNYEVPSWAKGKIMYHIFIDRFNRGNNEPMQPMPRRTIHNSWEEEMMIGPDKDGIWNADFYGGDLKGIIEKLDYIKSLGVSILYLSPVMHSQSNHRYDTSDYENVDPYAGNNEDLEKLCTLAHQKGMKVVLDAVFNHTGNDSKYFNEYGQFDTIGAYKNIDSPYASFYQKHYYNGEVVYNYWWGMPNLPVCDGLSKEWQEYILGENGVIDKWFKLGIDGLRLDVADELTDEYIEKIREAVKRNKEDGFILGEVWKNPMRMGRGYIESGKGMDSVMNYPLIDALIRYFKYADVDKLKRVITEIQSEYPDETINVLMNFTSTHDISRPLDIFGLDNFSPYSEWAWNPNRNDIEFLKKVKLNSEEYEHGKEIYKAFVFILNFMPGILSIFYGDEAGIEGLGNLANRKTYPWGKEDKDLVEYFRELGRIRNEELFLEDAKLNIIDINYEYIMFERIKNNEKMLIIVNRTGDVKTFNIPKEYENSAKVYTLNKSSKGILNPYGAISIKNRSDE